MIGALLQAHKGAAALRAREGGASTAVTSLRAFLEHARATVPFYRDLGPTLVPDAMSSLINAFPMVNRKQFANIGEAFVSNAFDYSTLQWETTSGTSGIPVRIPRDLASSYHFAYITFRLLSPFIRKFDSMLLPGCLGVVAVNDNPKRHPFSFVNPAIGCALVDRRILTGEESADARLLGQLRRERIPLLNARPRALLRLVDLDERESARDEGARIAPGAILASGDNLHSDERKRIECWFQCRVHNAYASQEAGVMAVECSEGLGLHVLTSHVLLEVVGEDGVIRPEGEGELVVTSTSNWAFPIIRYRTGDQGEIAWGTCVCGFHGPSVRRLAGRDSTWFEIGGRRTNPSVLNVIF